MLYPSLEPGMEVKLTIYPLKASSKKPTRYLPVNAGKENLFREGDVVEYALIGDDGNEYVNTARVRYIFNSLKVIVPLRWPVEQGKPYMVSIRLIMHEVTEVKGAADDNTGSKT